MKNDAEGSRGLWVQSGSIFERYEVRTMIANKVDEQKNYG